MMDAWIKTCSCRKRQQLNYEPFPSTSKSTDASVRELNSESRLSKPSLITKPIKKAKLFFRKYSPEYLKYGFVFFRHGDEPLPQCVICYETLANASLEPS